MATKKQYTLRAQKTDGTSMTKQVLAYDKDDIDIESFAESCGVDPLQIEIIEN